MFFPGANPASLFWWVATPLFFAWCVAPIYIPMIVAPKSWLVTIASLCLALYGLNIYAEAMFGPGVRSTSGLIFAFFPLHQSVPAAILLLVHYVVQYFWNRLVDE
ncbi:hypothetical protein [Parasphingorhabdus marina]|nr:hypothetical protein [Parasphingorhabdus marina]